MFCWQIPAKVDHRDRWNRLSDMTPKELLLSRQGRISRSQFFLGICALVGAGVVIEKALLLIFAWTARLLTAGHGATGNQVFGSIMFGLPSLVRLYFAPIFLLLCLLPLYRLVTKRCRDRNRAASFAAIFTAALFLPTVVFVTGRYIVAIGGGFAAGIIGNVYVQIVFGCFLIWALVELLVLAERQQGAYE